MKTYCFTVDDNIRFLKELTEKRPKSIFYSDYPAYQANFEQKLTDTFTFLEKHGYASRFFEEML